jgi:nitroreductase
MTIDAATAIDQAALDVVLNRRSPAKFREERPPRELIERLLEAAIRAPNHYLNEPWRFFVLTGAARERLGEVFAERMRRAMPDATAPSAQATLDRERKKTLRAPVVIAVAAVRTENARALPIEDIEATAAAVENILLAAPALGLGAYWRTGDAAYDDEIKAFFGLRPEDHIASFVYVGYPEVWGPLTPRTGLQDKVSWQGWED